MDLISFPYIIETNINTYAVCDVDTTAKKKKRASELHQKKVSFLASLIILGVEPHVMADKADKPLMHSKYWSISLELLRQMGTIYCNLLKSAVNIYSHGPELDL